MLFYKKDAQYNQNHKQNAENQSQVENDFINATAGWENGTRVIAAGNASHTYTTILQYNQYDCCDWSYNQSNIEKCLHFESP